MRKKLLNACLLTMMMVTSTTAWALSQVDGVYQIGTAEDLKAFADLVNGGDTYACAVLTADIDYGIESTMIGMDMPDGNTYWYNGRFDGQGHTVKLNMFPAQNGAALFQNVGYQGRITRVMTTGTITTEFKFAAGIAGKNRGVISRCATTVTVMSGIAGDGTHGGIVGVAQANSMVADCMSAMTITTAATINCGGLVGWSEGKSVIQNCLNINDFQFENQSGSAVTSRNFNSYVSQGYGLYYVTPFGDLTGGTQITEEDVKSGKACFLLNTDQHKIIWTQKIGEDPYPLPFGDRGQVYCSAPTACDGTTETEGATYSNSPLGGTPTAHTLTAGFCSTCKGVTTSRRYEGPSTHNHDFTGYYDYEFVERDSEGWYLVKTAEDMLWLANTETLNNEYFNCKFMYDIDYSDYGYWLNISNWFAGIVDGQGHKLTINIGPVTDSWSSGITPKLSGTVRNMWIDGTVTASATGGASVCGQAQDNNASIENVISTVDIISTVTGDGTHGGFVGRSNTQVHLTNCIFAGSIQGEGTSNCGGLVGWASNPTFVDNCIVAATFNLAEGDNNTFARRPTALRMSGRPNYYVNANGTVPEGVIQIDAADLASGAATFRMNGDQSVIEWTQALGTDEYPLPFLGHGQVYANPSGGYRCDGTLLGNVTYSNTEVPRVLPDHKYVDGFCSVCDGYDPDYLQPNADGFYELGTGRQLAWFAHKVVEGGNGGLNALLTADIDMNGENDHFRSIGTEANPYTGHFDGQHHVISNLNINEPGVKGVGLIGGIAGPAVIENTTLDNSCSIIGNGYVGMIGFSSPIVGAVTLRNLGNEADVTSVDGANAGGILGCSMSSSVTFTLENCYSTGTITGPTENGMLSGWLGANAVVTNCWSTSPITGFSDEATKFARRSSATFTNCYATDGDGSQATKITEDQVVSGELAYKLNGNQWGEPTWYQYLPEDYHPVTIPTHGHVYYYGGLFGSVDDESEFQTLRQEIKDTESSWIDGENFVAEDSLIEAYRTTIEGVDGCTTMKELYDYVNSMSGQKSTLQKSADAYNKYIARAQELRTILENDQTFQGDDREILAAYLDGEDEPNELYPNGAYYYIIDYHILSAEGIAQEMAFMNELYTNAVKFGYIEGTEITSLLTNPKFVDAFTTGWEGVLGSGKTSATLQDPNDSEKTATWVGAEAWNKVFDMHQTLHNMKEGVYLLKMNASQRASSSINTKSLNYTASMYLNDNLTYLPAAIETTISAEEAVDQVNANITGATADLTVTDGDGNVTGYYLHGQLSMAIAANSDRSPVYMVAQVGEDGELTVGIKNPGSGKGSDWVGFANTMLTYCGELSSEAAGAAIQQALDGQLERANLMLSEYEPFIDQNYAVQPNYSADLQAELAALVQEAQEAADNAAKYEYVQKFSDIFQRIYECKMAYVTMYKTSDLIESVVGMLSSSDPEVPGEITADEATEYYNMIGDLQAGYMDGVYSAEEALNPAGMEKLYAYVPEQNANGVYQLKDKFNMAYFAAYINSISPSANAVLCNDIDMKNVDFVGIGTTSSSYTGTFDGQGHTISNLKVNGGEYAGLFGRVGTCTIKNFILDSSCYIYGSAFVGVVGGSNGTVTVTIDQVGNEGIVESSAQNAGGIIGCNMSSSATFNISNCYVTGDILGGSESGAISGWTGGSKSSLTNVWAVCKVKGYAADLAFVRHSTSDVTTLSGCYALLTNDEGTVLSETDVTNVNAETLKSGSLTWSLNGSSSENPVWFQNLATDTVPRLFTGDVLYRYAGEFTNEKPVIELNSYAYGIDTNSDNDKVTVKYTLNSPARAAKINFYAGETKVYTEELAGDDLAKGSHAVEVANSNLGAAGTEITFDIEVTSIGVKENSQVKAPTESGQYMSNAVRSMAYNDNVESPSFGTLYVAEPKQGGTGAGMIDYGNGKPAGIYAFDPQFEQILAADSTPGFTGGLVLGKYADGRTGLKVYGENAVYDPKTVHFTADGRLFVGRMGGVSNSPIMEVDPENLDSWTPVFTDEHVLDSLTGSIFFEGEEVASNMAGLTSSGKGDDLTLWGWNARRSDGQRNPSDYFLRTYKLGTAKQFHGAAVTPFAEYDGKWGYNYSGMNIAADQRGGFWYISYVGTPTAERPSMKHVNAAGEVDYTNEARVLYGGGIWISRDGTMLAYPNPGVTNSVVIATTDYVPMANGQISLTPVVAVSTVDNYPSGIVLDHAGNLYVGSYKSQTLNSYVIANKDDVVTTTPSNSRANFKVGETKTGIEQIATEDTNDIYTIGGVKVEKAVKGVNIINGRKVMVK